ncbi:putative colanic acid biosynthesis acetyltransferase [Sinorhizobium sp. BG8]|uniref:putative colanic acid biosynthesis acetyltransferase n=1 Tax=Sinorhizobium sp. BG8 TaxID=2613773 RepID=UPI00193E2E1A|nr:putative colanic acid biosynthesis acetyltransferase [Sinorhizobium sp. BG8]QRM56452.1 putative colanic acid biosynthesis acetyltransferase [Sinorhizobium sp. BG8]
MGNAIAGLLDTRQSKPLKGGPTFSLRHRLHRLAWWFVWHGLGAWTPVAAHGWRRLLLRLFGARIDRTARIYPRVRVWYPPNLFMEAHSCLGRDVDCYCVDLIRLGEHAIVSQGARLCGATHDIDDPHFRLVARPIVVGRRAWIAAEAFVGPGVVVGDGAVLGARAVAFSDLEPMFVYAGNPARLLRERYPVE